MIDSKLWKVFSEYIRLRDSNENGYCTCITCGAVRHWKGLDAGHGIPRQYWATRYNEKNVHAQCKPCNGFEGGKREVYAQEVDKRYGKGSWFMLEFASKARGKRMDQRTMKILTTYYTLKVKELKKEKGL
jgi:hypothetical protein